LHFTSPVVPTVVQLFFWTVEGKLGDLPVGWPFELAMHELSLTTKTGMGIVGG
jgi:hypothetical protein